MDAGRTDGALKVAAPAALDSKAEQLIAAFGGREAILKRGSFGYSPPPGTQPVYN